MYVYTEASIDMPRAPRPGNMRLRLFFHWLSVPPLTKQKVSPTAFRDRLGVTGAGCRRDPISVSRDGQTANA